MKLRIPITHSKANILLLKAGENVSEYRGWFRVLVEGHFLFDAVRLDAALDIAWDRYKVIIVPEITALRDDLADTPGSICQSWWYSYRCGTEWVPR